MAGTNALARHDVTWASPAPARARRPRRRSAAAPWPGDVTPGVAISVEIPRWIEQRSRPPVTLLAMSIAGVLLADLSLLLYLV